MISLSALRDKQFTSFPFSGQHRTTKYDQQQICSILYNRKIGSPNKKGSQK
uniref:Uncharacterized protein n=1 Tax=Arion vulgaris TaxID=1028688 RepID=A0A0B6XXR1_9EUPU